MIRWLHIHLWGIDPTVGSQGNIHLRCRCGKTKMVKRLAKTHR